MSPAVPSSKAGPCTARAMWMRAAWAAPAAKAQLSGSGDLSLGVVDSLDVSLSGSGDLSYAGRPKLTPAHQRIRRSQRTLTGKTGGAESPPRRGNSSECRWRRPAPAHERSPTAADPAGLARGQPQSRSPVRRAGCAALGQQGVLRGLQGAAGRASDLVRHDAQQPCQRPRRGDRGRTTSRPGWPPPPRAAASCRTALSRPI